MTELQVKVLPMLEAQARRGFPSSTPAASSEAEGTEDGAVAQRSQDDDGGESRSCDPLVSTLLVAPRLHPFNSALFENLARNVDIALKQTPIIDRVEVEVSSLRDSSAHPPLSPSSPLPLLVFFLYSLCRFCSRFLRWSRLTRWSCRTRHGVLHSHAIPMYLELPGFARWSSERWLGSLCLRTQHHSRPCVDWD